MSGKGKGSPDEVGADLEALTLLSYTNDDDSELFKPPPPEPECPICMLPVPLRADQSTYMTCCGKLVCTGCVYENLRVLEETNKKNSKCKRPPLVECCSFCRTPYPTTDTEVISRTKKRVELNDPDAMCNLAVTYAAGWYGLPKDESKALKLFHRAVELGSANACFGLATLHASRNEFDKYREYLEMAAKRGKAVAHYRLGVIEIKSENYELALKHWMISAAAGDKDSLNSIKEAYKVGLGLVRKDDFAAALRAYHATMCEQKSKERDRAAEMQRQGWY